MNSKSYFISIVALLLITDLFILLDIPFLRQVFGFLFLGILPGLLILKLFKLNEIDFSEKIVLVVGLSTSFLMIFGLLVNNSLHSLGYKTPLSTISLLISFNIALVIFVIVDYKTNKDINISLPRLNLGTSEKAFLIVPILFPALSILGTYIMRNFNNNIILMILLFIIPTYIIFVCFFRQKFPKWLYPIVIFLISISLLLIFMLRFPHICGHDVHTEYGYFFLTTLDNCYWSTLSTYSSLDACLSISLLPTIYQSILDVNAQEYLFKGVYVSICCFGPLGIYAISKKYVGELYAFLASFFFIAQTTFLHAAGSPRTNVAIFFVVLAVMIFFNDKIAPLKKKILFIVFMWSMVVSHYATVYIFFFILVGVYVGETILSKRDICIKKTNFTLVLILFSFIFFWYSQVTETAFDRSVEFFEATFINLNNLFVEDVRTEAVTQLVGRELTYPIISRINFAFTWGTFIFIGVGILTMVLRYKEMVSLANIEHKKPDFLKTKFEVGYLVMVLVCAGLLVAMIVFPYVSLSYGIQRLYSEVIIILSVCFVIGGITLQKILDFITKGLQKKQKVMMKGKGNALQVPAYLIILLILIPYFLFVTGAMHQICGIQEKITLYSGGIKFNKEYVYDQESYAAKWVKNNYVETNNRLYTADGLSKRKLISQGKFSRLSIDDRSFFRHNMYLPGYLYLSYTNVVDGQCCAGEIHNISNYADIFVENSKIYDGGGSEVYKL